MKNTYVNSNVIVKTLMVIVDYISVICGIVSAYNLRLLYHLVKVTWYRISIIGNAYIITPLLFITVLFLNHGYKIDTSYWEKVKIIFRSITIGIVLSIVLMYAGHIINNVSRLFVIYLMGLYYFTSLYSVIS